MRNACVGRRVLRAMQARRRAMVFNVVPADDTGVATDHRPQPCGRRLERRWATTRDEKNSAGCARGWC